MHLPCREAITKQHFPQEDLVNPVIGLIKVQFKENRSLFCEFKLMSNLLEHNGALQDETDPDKRRMASMNNPM